MTLVVNLFGGPGVGKSTTAAMTYALLKQSGVNAEMAHEYAKDLTWEDRQKAIRFQPYVTAKQIWRVHRLLDQVDVVITDSPILLSMVYKGEGYTHEFAEYVLATFNNWQTLNVLLTRNPNYKYNPKGRKQTEEQSIQLDLHIRTLLDVTGQGYLEAAGGGTAAEFIYSHVMNKLNL